MVAAGLFDEAFSGLVHLGWIAVHATQDVSLGHKSHNCSPTMAMGRRKAIWGVLKLESDDGLSGCASELVVLEYSDDLSRPSPMRHTEINTHTMNTSSNCNLLGFFDFEFHFGRLEENPGNGMSMLRV